MSINIINGTPGADLIRISDTRGALLGLDTLVDGNGGADTIYAGAGNDWIEGLYLDPSNVQFFGGPGDDYLVALTYGDDWLQAGTGNTVAIGGGGNDTLIGGAGNDQLWAGSGDNMVIAGSGNTLLVVDTDVGGRTRRTGNNELYAGGTLGQDTLIAGTGNDTLIAGNGPDQLWAGRGTDQLIGGLGSDTMVGGAGSATFTASPDLVRDVMIGGSGPDTFNTAGVALAQPAVFDASHTAVAGALNNVDVIWNFQLGDILHVSTLDLQGNNLSIESGYFSSIGLSGTLVSSVDSGTFFGSSAHPEHGIAFLAGVQTDYATLVANGSLVIG